MMAEIFCKLLAFLPPRIFLFFRSEYAVNLQEGDVESGNRVVKIALHYGCSSVNLLYIFRTPFYKNTCKGLLLALQI